MALEYASLTYTEAMFLMVQAWFLWMANKMFDRSVMDEQYSNWQLLRNYWKQWLLLGLAFYTLYFTRTVGVGAAVVVPLVFLIYRKIKLAVIATMVMAVSAGVFEGLKRVVWAGAPTIKSNQSDILFQKDAYDASKGTEDFAGFIDRFIGNTMQYLSSRFWEILGFRADSSTPIESLTVITLLPLLIGLIIAIRKRQYIIALTTFYLGILLGITFLVLQISWGQGRLVMVFVPLIAIVGMYTFYELFKLKSFKGGQIFFVMMLGVFLFVGMKTTLGKIKDNVPIAKSNLVKGDKFAGYTDDWRNYLELSEWCADSLPPQSLVACRKAPMSFVYGKGMRFYGVYRGNGQTDADSLLAELKKAKVTHVIFANLRINPKLNGDVQSQLPPGYPDVYNSYIDSDGCPKISRKV
jgi:hypothetical protein